MNALEIASELAGYCCASASLSSSMTLHSSISNDETVPRDLQKVKLQKTRLSLRSFFDSFPPMATWRDKHQYYRHNPLIEVLERIEKDLREKEWKHKYQIKYIPTDTDPVWSQPCFHLCTHGQGELHRLRLLYLIYLLYFNRNHQLRLTFSNSFNGRWSSCRDNVVKRYGH